MSEREQWRLKIPITGKCNLTCAYCYNQQRYKTTTVKQDAQIVRFFKAPGKKKEVVFFGGEPLLEAKILRRTLATIKKQAHIFKKTVKLSLCTNLTVFNLDLLQKFDYIYVSLDGTKLSHDSLRRPPNFDLVFKNLKQFKGNKNFSGKIKLNKIIHPRNVHFLKDDFIFLKTLQIPFDISLAAGVSGWDKSSLEMLKLRFNEIISLINKDFEKRDMTSIFFYRRLVSLPGVFCPFSSVTLDLLGQPTFCEFTALSKSKNRKISTSQHNKKCSYDLNNKKCLFEECLKCGLICQKFNLIDGKKLKKDDMAGLKQAGDYKNVILKEIAKKHKLRIPRQIEIINCQKNNWHRAVNFVILLKRFLQAPKHIELFIRSNHQEFFEKFKNSFLKISFSVKNIKNFDFNQDALIFDCSNQDVYFLRPGENKKNIGNMRRGIFIGNL